jgi:hypothetical protein
MKAPSEFEFPNFPAEKQSKAHKNIWTNIWRVSSQNAINAKIELFEFLIQESNIRIVAGTISHNDTGNRYW